VASASHRPEDALLAECRVFTRYLVAQEPGEYLCGRYAHGHSASQAFRPAGAFDRFLLRVAKASPLLALLADSYACLFARQSALRKKLILLLGILESMPPDVGFSEEITEVSRPMVFLKLAARGALFALRLALAVAIFLPFHVLLSLVSGESGSGQ